MVKKLQARKWTGRIGALIVILPLMACTTISENKQHFTSKPLRAKEEITLKGAGEASFSAALTPLEDLGLRKRDIPEFLAQLAKNPYYPPPKPFKCDDVKHEMAQLDELLGGDADEPKVALGDGEEYAMAGAEMIQDTVVGMVKSQVNIIPFKSIVRRLTGANKHEKLVAKAIQGGNLRRAYLRGLSTAQFGDSCLPGPRVVTAELNPDGTEKAPEPVTLSDRLELATKTW